MSKILREEVYNNVPSCGGLTDLIDGVIYTFYNITSQELDIICMEASDKEIETFMDALGSINKPASITDIRAGIAVRNKYVDYYKNKNV